MVDSITLFEKSLLRISGESITDFFLGDNEYAQLLSMTEILRNINAEVDHIKKEICDHLFIFVQHSNSSEERIKAIKFKRDIFNGRPFSDKMIEIIDEFLPIKIKELFHSYQEIVKKACLENETYKKLYEDIYQHDKCKIVDFCKKDNFKDGLLLSSKYLFQTSKNINIEKLKDDHLTLGYLKYITRVIAKTSPFSTFTNISLCNFSENELGYSMVLQNEKLVHKIKYNNFIYSYFIELFVTNRFYRKKMIIKINDTISKKANKFCYFTNIKNIESFQTVKYEEILNYILDVLQKEKTTTLEFLILILQKKIDASFDDILDYVHELVQTGMIEYVFPFSGLDDDWESKLELFIINQIGCSDKSDLSVLFGKLRIKKVEYSDSENRERTLEEIADILKLIESVLGKEGKYDGKYIKPYLNSINSHSEDVKHKMLYDVNRQQNILKSNIIYDDTRVDIQFDLNKSTVTEFVDIVNRIVNSFANFCSFNSQKVLLHKHLKKIDLDKINILSLLEELNVNKDDFKDNYNELIVDYQRKNENLREVIKEQTELGNIAKFSDGININNDVLNSIRAIDTADIFCNNSYSIFVQFFVDDSDSGEKTLKGVVNHVHPGYGKMYGRFLHLFNPDVTDQLRLWNRLHSPDNILLVEINDASPFNANLHPPLVENEMVWPGGYSRLPDNRQININDIFINFIPESGRFELIDSDKRKISALDLGFQSLSGRSELFKLLSNMSHNNYFNFNAVAKHINYNTHETLLHDGIKITSQPRLVVESKVIMQRAKWTFELLPLRKYVRKISLHDFYYFLQNMKKKISLPDEVFLSLNGELKEKKNKNYDRKPQYINLNSPSCVRLFHTIICNSENLYLVVEEMLPSSKQLFSIKKRKYVTENIIQWARS